jgi:hypothetical protein
LLIKEIQQTYVDTFILKFEYAGKPHILEVEYWTRHYKIVYKVVVEECEIVFEDDEEGTLRAIVNQDNCNHKLEPGLVEDIARRIEEAANS